jgi:acyl-CoA synthetase (AMP-forming)/AMP-acid ligase II
MSDALTILDLIHRWGHIRPDRIAFRILRGDDPAGDERTFAALRQQSFAVARALAVRTRPGYRAVLLFDTEPGFIVSFFGCLAAGVIAVPADPPHGRRAWTGIERIVADCEPALVLTSRVIAGRWHDELSRLASARGLEIVVVDDLSDDDDAVPLPAVAPGDVAFLQYTSGSTAHPKGVMVTHANILANVRMLEEAFALDEHEQIVGWLPLFHDMGLIGFVLVPVYVGCTSTIMSPAAFLEQPARWLRAIARHRGTISSSPNFGYELAAAKIRADDRGALDLSSWRAALNGSEPVSAATLRRFEHAFAASGFRAGAFRPCYGMAESTLLISAVDGRPVRTLAAERAAGGPADAPFRVEASDVVGCGRPYGDGAVAIVDPATGRECADGAVGEVWFRGGNVAAGYWRNPQATAGTFDAHLNGRGGYLRTGDLGCIDEGELFLVGRMKELIIVRGRNVAPQDIEAAVAGAHESLRTGHVAAVGVTLETGQQLAIVAEVGREHWRTFDPEAVVDAVLQAVQAEFGLGAAAVTLLRPGGMPKTTSGKLKRLECRRRLESGAPAGDTEWRVLHEWRLQAPAAAASAVAAAPPTPSIAGLDRDQVIDAVLDWLRARLAQALECRPDQIGDEEPFARWGLDSAVAVTLTGELAAWLQVELDPTVFWEYAHPLALAEHLAGLVTERAGAGDPVELA